MSKRRSSGKRVRQSEATSEAQVFTGASALHELFQQQMRNLLDRTDLDEEQKQAAMLGASCPCCGAGGFSFTAKLKPLPRSSPRKRDSRT
ncbi:MAG TPA: hypothetical protein VKW08_28410 [Xanthobacteraceae bacterium]|nr:hypothetical protein [Xanthobacteraceae bacterium]